MAKKSLWRRFIEWFKGTEPVPAPPPPPLPVIPTPPLPEVKFRPAEPRDTIAVLSRGDVYELRIHADLEWSTSAMTYAELMRQAGEYTGAAHDELRRRVWRIGRNYGPHQAAQAEAEMRRQAGDWCYDTDKGLIRCVADIRVVPDERVREHLVPYALREIDLDAEAVLGHQRADLLEKLVARWRTLLTASGASPITVAAAQLSDPAFAAVLNLLAEKRRAQGRELVDVLGQATRDHEQLGLFEFAEMYASAAAAFLSQLNEEDQKFVRDMVNADLGGSRS
ncbi:hypothetical protein AB0M02_04915 [Actinoplanes sp. NPDC051861]|uniref:hypothetical protein n=1 Tax=Actinoplanes sp. NPDC051861 TaxID=3155170 RepID=UPI00343A215E